MALTTPTCGPCTGIPQEIDVTPVAGHDFGNQNVGDGATAAFTYTATNVGNINLVMGTVSITGTNSTHFIVDADDCSGQTLAPGADCTSTSPLTRPRRAPRRRR